MSDSMSLWSAVNGLIKCVIQQTTQTRFVLRWLLLHRKYVLKHCHSSHNILAIVAAGGELVRVSLTGRPNRPFYPTVITGCSDTEYIVGGTQLG